MEVRADISCDIGAILLLVKDSCVRFGNYRPNWNTWSQSDIRLSYIDKIRRLVKTDERCPLAPKSHIRHYASDILCNLSKLFIFDHISSNPTN
jgi:hypothetical protein